MKTRLLFLPDDMTAIELESSLDADEVMDNVRCGAWKPPLYCRPPFSPPAWRAIRQGQRVIILPWDDLPRIDLTARQIEVIAGLSEGMKLRELAQHMHISMRTLCCHITLIKQRLGTSTLAQTVSRAAELGIYPPVTPAE